TGRDAGLLVGTLEHSGFRGDACKDLDTLCNKLGAAVCAAVIAEEALKPSSTTRLGSILNTQPTWSDFPLVLLTVRRARESGAGSEFAHIFRAYANVTVLERPLSVTSLLSTI